MLNAINSKLRGLLVSLFLFPLGSQAQFWEVGGSLGGANYTGDLARKMVLAETNLSAGAFGKYNFNEYFSWKFGLNYGKISGGDYNFKEYSNRNLSFFSHIIELDNRIEFNFIRFGTSSLAKRATPFFFSGLNVFHHDPRTEINGMNIKLRPLGTEGQNLEGNRKYLPVIMAIPIGLGYKYSISDNWVLSGEIGARRTFTDYLDDVSGIYPNFQEVQGRSGSTAVQLSDRSGEVAGEPMANPGDWRGDPKLKDWYFIAHISLTYRFCPIRCMFYNF